VIFQLILFYQFKQILISYFVILLVLHTFRNINLGTYGRVAISDEAQFLTDPCWSL